MAPTSDHSHPSIDQNQKPPTVPESSSYPHPHPHPHSYPRSDQLDSLLQSNDSVLNPQRTRTSTSTGTSTSSPSRLVTPTFDKNSTININNMASAINVPYSPASALPSSGKEVDLSSYYGYGYNPTVSGYGFGQSSNSSTSLQTGFGGNNTTSATSDPPYSPLTGNQYMAPDFSLNFQNLPGHGYGNTDNDNATNAAIWQATQSMYGKYDFMNANTNTNPTPTSASTQALFKSTEPGLQTIPIDQARLPFDGPTPTRSPSPLFEIDEADSDGDGDSSPELNEIRQSRRRASDTTPSSSRPPPSTRKRRNASLSINTGRPRLSTSHLDPEEKARRAAAAEGLDKGDKRRMQNKLAQRAFRARSKIVNKTAAGRLEQLEQLTEQQAGRIGNLTELVGRLQKENYALKSAKFQEELMKGGMGMGMGRQDMT